MRDTVNVLIVGVGGQGVLKTSEVLADVLMREGYDVKQSEVHGMSQRGDSGLEREHIMGCCEAEGMDCGLGLARTSEHATNGRAR